jgi:hypothetical protein
MSSWNVIESCTGPTPGCHWPLFAAGLQVQPGTKAAAGSSDNDDASFVITMPGIEKRTQAGEHRVVDGVQAFRAIERKQANRASLFEIQRAIHAADSTHTAMVLVRRCAPGCLPVREHARPGNPVMQPSVRVVPEHPAGNDKRQALQHQEENSPVGRKRVTEQ